MPTRSTLVIVVAIIIACRPDRVRNGSARRAGTRYPRGLTMLGRRNRKQLGEFAVDVAVRAAKRRDCAVRAVRRPARPRSST